MRFLSRFPQIALAAVVSASLALAGPPIAPISSGQGFSRVCGPVLEKPTVETTKYGPRHLFKSDPKLSGKVRLREKGTLKIMSYNVLNLIESPGKYVDVDGERVFRYGKLLKPRDQIDGVIRNIRAENPDIIVGVEIESLHAMEQFDKSGLGDLYYRILVPGNDERGINIAYFVRKDLAVDIEWQSHKEIVHDYRGRSTEVFSRDFPVVSFRDPGAPEGSDPLLIVAGVHLKSQRSDTEDLLSIGKRTDQVKVMRDVIGGYDEKYGGRVPILMMGDFNADVVSGPEFAALKEAGYADAFDVMKIPPKSDARVTQCYFPKDGEPSRSQLDAAFASKTAAKKIVAARVVPDLDARGQPLGLPTTIEERNLRPSDHRAVTVTIDLAK